MGMNEELTLPKIAIDDKGFSDTAPEHQARPSDHPEFGIPITGPAVLGGSLILGHRGSHVLPYLIVDDGSRQTSRWIGGHFDVSGRRKAVQAARPLATAGVP